MHTNRSSLTPRRSGASGKRRWDEVKSPCSASHVTRHLSHVTQVVSLLSEASEAGEELCAICHEMGVLCRTSHVTRRTSHVTRHVARHKPQTANQHVTHHTSHVTRDALQEWSLTNCSSWGCTRRNAKRGAARLQGAADDDGLNTNIRITMIIRIIVIVIIQ